ncbi:MAG: ABC transporter permease [Coriobacteriia bacterium]|nr:ABC transporter permease [Coriobacteriia bacterium]
MRHVLHIALKDLRVYTRDISAFGILLAMPAVLIVILGMALGGAAASGSGQINVAIVNLDRGSVSATSAAHAADLEKRFTDTSQITALFQIESSSDQDAVRKRVAAGELAAALVIPEGFGADLQAGRATKLEVIKDPGSPTSAGIWESVVKAVAAFNSAGSIVVQTTMQAAQTAQSPILSQSGEAALRGYAVSQLDANALDSVTVADGVAGHNAATDWKPLDYYTLAMTAMFLMFCAMYGAFSVVGERRERTMARILASPAPRSAVIGGKMLGIFVLGVAQFAVLYLFTRFVLNVNWGESVAAIVLVALAEIAAVTGLGMLISSLAHSERAVGGIGPLTVQIMALLGGSFFPISILPIWLQPIRYLSVVGWTMEGWRRIQVQGAGVSGVLGPVAALLAFAAVFYAFSVWRTRAGAA